MELASSSIYESAELMREQLHDHFYTDQGVPVVIGQPKKASDAVSEGEFLLNLFFYKIQPSGFFPDTGPRETWWARLHCLITAFGSSNAEGGDELKIIGQVLNYFHENPILKGSPDGSTKSFWLEVILQPLGSEEINQLWSTFGSVPYGPSLAYEVSLVPVEPKVKSIPAPPVLSGGLLSGVAAHSDPAGAGPPSGPVATTIGRIEVDLSQQDWAPAIAFVDNDKASPSLTRSWADVVVADTNTFADVWIAGEASAEIDLVWQSAMSGSWKDLPDPLVEQAAIPTQATSENQLTLDPSVLVSAVQTQGVANEHVVPGDLGIEKAAPDQPNSATQFLIYARRKLADGSVVKSNPLILNITGSRYVVEGEL